MQSVVALCALSQHQWQARYLLFNFSNSFYQTQCDFVVVYLGVFKCQLLCSAPHIHLLIHSFEQPIEAGSCFHHNLSEAGVVASVLSLPRSACLPRIRALGKQALDLLPKKPMLLIYKGNLLRQIWEAHTGNAAEAGCLHRSSPALSLQLHIPQAATTVLAIG